MASAVASKVSEVPKPVFLMDVLASPSASGKTVVTSVGHLFSIGGARPRSSSSDGVKDSTGKRDGVKDSTGEGGGVKGSTEGDGVKDPTGEKNAAAGPRPERHIPIPKLFATRDVLDRFPEAAMRERDLLLALGLAENGGGAAAASKTGFSVHECWVSKADADAVQLKLAMPGLGKEHVKMRVEKDALVIKGEGDKDSEGGGDKVPPRYSYQVELASAQAFKLDQIKAEMKNGVLMVTVPRIKDEERKDVFEIKVE